MNERLRPSRLNMTLEDRLSQEEGWIYMTGMQALVRLPIQQHKRDRAAGLNTGGYISGYRGSPVGTYDLSLKQAAGTLSPADLEALAAFLNKDYNPDTDYLPPDLASAAEAVES